MSRTLLLLAFLLAACGSQPTPSGSSSPTGAGDEATFLEQWEANLPQARETASEYELGLIEDGVVTAEEHEDAIVRHLACITAADLHVIRLDRAPTGMIVEVAVAEEADVADEPMAACEAEFYDLARAGFRATTLDPDGTEAERLAALAACVRDGGVTEVPADAGSFEEVRAIVEELPEENLLGQQDPEDVLDACVLREWY